MDSRRGAVARFDGRSAGGSELQVAGQIHSRPPRSGDSRNEGVFGRGTVEGSVAVLKPLRPLTAQGFAREARGGESAAISSNQGWGPHPEEPGPRMRAKGARPGQPFPARAPIAAFIAALRRHLTSLRFP